MKHTIRLTESKLTELIKESLKRALCEDHWFGDDDDYDKFEYDPYRTTEYDNRGPLDGYWSLYDFSADITDCGDDVKFEVTDRRLHKPNTRTWEKHTITGEDAKVLKDMILARMKENVPIEKAINDELNQIL